MCRFWALLRAGVGSRGTNGVASSAELSEGLALPLKRVSMSSAFSFLGDLLLLFSSFFSLPDDLSSVFPGVPLSGQKTSVHFRFLERGVASESESEGTMVDNMCEQYSTNGARRFNL